MMFHRTHTFTIPSMMIAGIACVSLIAWGCEHSPQRAVGGQVAAPIVAPAALRDVPSIPGIQRDTSDDQWVFFGGESDEFEALFPPGADPKRVDDAVDTPIGSQKIVRFVFADDEAGYDAGYLIRGKSPLAALAGEKRILDSACEGTAKHMGGRLITTAKREVDGHAARDIEIELPADDAHPHGAHATARLIITDNRIYHAIVRNDHGTQPAPHAPRFIEALHAGTL